MTRPPTSLTASIQTAARTISAALAELHQNATAHEAAQEAAGASPGWKAPAPAAYHVDIHTDGALLWENADRPHLVAGFSDPVDAITAAAEHQLFNAAITPELRRLRSLTVTVNHREDQMPT